MSSITVYLHLTPSLRFDLFIYSCFSSSQLNTRVELHHLPSHADLLTYFAYWFTPVSRYTPAARLAEVIYDSTLVTFTYDEASGTVKTIHLTHNGFISSIRYRQTGTTRARVHTHTHTLNKCNFTFRLRSRAS